MSQKNLQLFEQRRARYTTAMRNEMPDCVPIRPFAAEFTGTFAGYTSQELVHDYPRAFDAALKCMQHFDWDAAVPNMVYVWTGLAQALQLDYYAIPGIDIDPEVGFQYREPTHPNAYMLADEYDELIDDPTAFLWNKWLPRASHVMPSVGEPSTYAGNLALVKTAMAMQEYFYAFGPACERMRTDAGTPGAIAGIFKAPMDIIADKMRGYLGLVEDLHERPEKVLAACEALMPHLVNVALTTADPQGEVPIGFWMHRGCVPLVSPKTFDDVYWATLKPAIQEIWAKGKQVLFYAEGNWDYHLEAFCELPEKSIVYHVDQGDIFKARDVLGDKFCLSGGIPNTLLGFKKPADVRAKVKEVIEGVAGNGGYILDASAIIQNDAKVENIQAMTDAGREFGVYSQGHSGELVAGGPRPSEQHIGGAPYVPPEFAGKTVPGQCTPWSTQQEQCGEIPGDEQIVEDVWNGIDGHANAFIWQMLLSF